MEECWSTESPGRWLAPGSHCTWSRFWHQRKVLHLNKAILDKNEIRRQLLLKSGEGLSRANTWFISGRLLRGTPKANSSLVCRKTGTTVDDRLNVVDYNWDQSRHLCRWGPSIGFLIPGFQRLAWGTLTLPSYLAISCKVDPERISVNFLFKYRSLLGWSFTKRNALEQHFRLPSHNGGC